MSHMVVSAAIKARIEARLADLDRKIEYLAGLC